MIRKSSPNPYSASVQRKVEQLYDCVRYCENESSCRRTMQLKFFGEKFEGSRCNKTCDNCKAGRVPDRRDLTGEARSIIELFNSLIQQSRRKGGGVTMNQLSELFRGSKAKSITKNFNVNGLRGYGAGSKYKKHDVDRITHEMIFEKILTETSSENNGGFFVDYVSLGENAASLENGSRKLFVEFPQKSNAIVKKPQKEKSSDSKRTKQQATKKCPSGARNKDQSEEEGGLHFAEADLADSDNDSHIEFLDSSSSKRESIENVLPEEHAKQIIANLKRLITIWAEAEQVMGNNVQCESEIVLFLVFILL